MSEVKYANRLINEKSPYLLQHAHNPVDWYSWSNEAFERAAREDKPIFLSIGYSTCHWCHVMERESFEDEEVADILNSNFVSIKVDREERPDIDSIYMTVCQALTGHGGWPLTIIMTPDKKPFFAGTYFPKDTRYGHSGLISILNNVREAWTNKRNELVSSSQKIISAIQDTKRSHDEEEIGRKTVHDTFRSMENLFDPNYGGLGTAPKFPTPHNLSFLLRYWNVRGSGRALEMAEKTLEHMYKGGIFDHIGFGFSRYSTDQKWLVPHFEKMLYDNALLAISYTEAYQAVGKALYKEIVEKIFTYVLRDMTSPEGGFYSAEDADSEGEEGKFYVWTVDEVKSVVGEEDGELFCEFHHITPTGNFEGKSIPNLLGQNLEHINNNVQLKNRLDAIRQKLFELREQREHPHKDDKILTAWNGLMIAALSHGGRVLNKQEYIDAAQNAVQFIFDKLTREDGRLLARYRDGESAYPAYLDDYAFLVWGLIELYEATFEPVYLDKALTLNRDMLEYFEDEEGGLFLYGKDSEQLIVRPKEVYDGAMPSGNSVAALNMLRLARLTGDRGLEEKVDNQFEIFGGRVKENPVSYTYFIMALLFKEIPTKEIVIAGQKEGSDAKVMLDEINERFLPYSTIILNTGEEVHRLVPFTKEQPQVDNEATAYICENFACNPPVTELDKLIPLLEKNQRI